MSAEVRAPTARVCERCGREEYWDESLEAWQIVRDDGDKQAGNPHCLHEWDINGTFNPVVERSD
ncbi:HEWD family protein [Halopiger goleimassiliensis]|uniref:HEWD family protein n=1 Tax=Halopiger goleimassiliensis TaxID=1293048 RepID=UPI0006781D38|nr:HEWD family protein [Halopiger goleimassiliensis]